jgi:hypothetical protein
VVVGDRERDGEMVRPPRAAVEQLHAELRPRHDAHDQAMIEHGQAGVLEHLPPDLRLHV